MKCVVCSDVGVLGKSPDGEFVYCEECVKGIDYALERVNTLIQIWKDIQRLYEGPFDLTFYMMAEDSLEKETQRKRELLDIRERLLAQEEEES